MFSTKRFFTIAILSCLLFVGITSCVRQDFDEPQFEEAPELDATGTIADIKSVFVADAFTEITEDWLIKAVVIGDDESGNFYKTLIIQDGTGGIELKLNAVSLFNNYPIGRTIYLKAKGLIVSDYNGLIQIGGGTYTDNSGNLRLGGIEDLNLDTYITKGNYGALPTPKVVNITDLTIADASTLISVTGVQFAEGSNGLFYADADNKITTNRILEDCDGASMIVRTSGYASFAAENTPTGKGTIVGIYSFFGDDKQLYIRNTSDVAMTEARCDGSTGGGGGGGPVVGEPIAIGDLRALFAAGTTAIPAGKKIVGVVISDKSTSSITGKNVIIQGADGKGMVIRFASNNTFNLGDNVEVVVGGQTLSEFNGTLQISGVPNASASSTGPGTQPTPVVVTIAQLTANFEQYESTLVKIENASFAAAGTFGYDNELTDGTGTIVHFANNFSTFAASALPTGTFSMTCIPGEYNLLQVAIRNLGDIQ